jgi:hypothetical protein
MSYSEVPEDNCRFFARLRSFDIACPRCDYVQVVKPSTNKRIWNNKLARFECMGCHLILHLGVIAWKGAHGMYRSPPDQTPTVKQALALRRGLNVWTQTRLMRGRSTNVLSAEPPPVEKMIEKFSPADPTD